MAFASPIGGGQTGGAGARPHRRLGSVAAMLAGPAAGAGLAQVSPTAVIAIAAILVPAVAATFLIAGRVPARRTPAPAPAPAGCPPPRAAPDPAGCPPG